MSDPRLILASASPRRKELIEQLRIPFEVMPADIDESPLPDESAAAHVSRLALAKAQIVANRCCGAVVVGADTIVILEEDSAAAEILGKPADAAEAKAMLRTLSGRRHWVFTSIAICGEHPGLPRERTVRTAVFFRELDDEEIDHYIASGDPFDKAGAYGIQGLAGSFVERLEGSYLNVVGLPLVELRNEMKKTNLFWNTPAKFPGA